MLRLETLGGLALTGESGTGPTTQPRRLALLVLLASAGERGLSRDKVIGYLWPESPPEKARHALEQVLYALRQSLGDALFLGTNPLRLNPEIMAADVTAFESAIERGALTEAVSLYRGPFLDGFYLSDGAEFEQWVESERARLIGAYARALERLAEQASGRGDSQEAVAWWRKLVALDGLSSRNVLGLLRSLAAAGDRPEALRFARAYEELVRQELDTSPDPALRAYVRELRARHDTPVASVVGVVPRRTPPTIALGERYQIERELGHGGMAIVYLARDLKHDRAVALKVLRPEIAAALGAERFLREIQIAARLQHPHILPLYDSGAVGSELYYVMPFVEGMSLRERLNREKQLPVEEAVRIARDVASALSHAHSHDIVHRDIKPENILLSGGEAVVADFGVARAITAAGGEQLTEAGVALGTPGYMSPEQAAGSPDVDRRSDVYSLGCVLYEMLAGQPPFTGPTIESIVRQHLAAEAPPVTRIRTAVPSSVADALARALAKTPADRFVTALEFAEAIAPRGAMAPPAWKVRPRLLIGFAAIAGAVVAGTWVTRRISESSPPPALDPNRVLVVPFRVTSADSSLLVLREGIVDLMAARLTGDGGPVAVDPRTALAAWRRASAADGGDVPEGTLVRMARSLGAGQLLLGEVVATQPGELLLSGRVVSSRDGRTGPQATAAGRPDSLLAVIDELVSRLLILRAGEDPQRLTALMTTSTQALDAFLRGRAESRLGHDAAARRYFARALDSDSTFALAAVELALARGWLFRWTTIGADSITRTRGVQFGGGAPTSASEQDQWDRAMDLAWRGRDRLNKADRALLNALRGERHPSPSFAREMLAHWEQAVRAAPERPEAHYTLGSVLLSQGLAMGLADSRTRAGASFRHALELDSAFLSPITGLIEIAALERDAPMLRRLQALYLARDSLGDEADYVRWLGAAVLRDETELRTVRSRFPALDLGVLLRIARTSQMHGISLDDAERAVSAVLGRTYESHQRQIVLWYAGFLALNRGQPGRALELMKLKREVDPSSQLLHGFALRYALWWDGDSLAGASAARAFESSLSPSARASPQAQDLGPPAFRSLSLALWRLWHGDTTGAVDAITLNRRGNLTQQQADLLEALLAGTLKRPDATVTLAKLDSLALLGCCGMQFINLVSARLQERAGDLPGALAAIRRGRWFFPPMYLSTYLQEEGRLAALTADTAGAIAAYRHYLTLRSNPEPSLQPSVDSVRAELARLERRR